ncbi:RCC1/BLIP-II [Durotheca rogersii]|uniref:RCC1/BLIP-II n=1 Tax=Durotheca rogersii TaxID=419775 RepID=UPI00221E65BA|nr:RCC1/BLIP-II [Durotheca rogersii]KAI5867916.1 RCC1/BLIP-II [Durotheca rogersii]
MDGLFALGSNGSGQLGLGHRTDVSVPKPVRFDPPLDDTDEVVCVAAGGNHTIALTRAGCAYWAGDPSTGACGVVRESSGSGSGADTSSGFHALALDPGADRDGQRLRHVVYAACTWDASVLALRDDEDAVTQVYVCGGDMTVAIADTSVTDLTTLGMPLLLTDFPPPGTQIVSLSAGLRHVVAVLDNGDAWGWGAAHKGQLGEEDAAVRSNPGPDSGSGGAIVKRPRKIGGVPFAVAAAACTQHATCLIAAPGDGRVLVLGADGRWALRTGAPTEAPDWAALAAGWGAVYILRRGGTLLAWGRDDHGQMPPPGLPELERVVAGSEHVVALTRDGNVLSWGWGEHGNCGPTTAGQSGDVKGRWNVLASVKNLPEGSSITAIGAGCATSWINIAMEGIFL